MVHVVHTVQTMQTVHALQMAFVVRHKAATSAHE
jgi:hypothetical protein